MTDLLTKSFNKWCQSSESWLPDKLVYGNMESVDLNKLKTEPCYGGVDLSSVSDLTSVSLMFPPNEYRDYHPDKYIFYSVPYVPGEALDESVNRDFYKRCIDCGHLRDTKSKSVDYDFILKDLLNIA
jgi:phage terminase large subunit-like protein